VSRENGQSLRVLAGRRSFRVGVAVNAAALRGDGQYADIVGREFNLVVPENALKMGPLRPAPDEFDFSDADGIVAFAEQHGMAVRGHTLVWHRMLPEWFEKGCFTSEEVARILRAHIQTVVDRYRGRIYAWDVVNEAVDERGILRDSFFLRMLGPGYVADVFRWAHEADPDARLFYNDYEIEAINPKSTAVYAMVGELCGQGMPVHGIGIQGHILVRPMLDFQSMAANVRRFRALGLDVEVTEADVRGRVPFSDNDLRDQAYVYAELMRLCLDVSPCDAFLVWGVTDRYSWVPEAFVGEGAPLLFDDAGCPKPAYYAVQDALQGIFPPPLCHIRWGRDLVRRMVNRVRHIFIP